MRRAIICLSLLAAACDESTTSKPDMSANGDMLLPGGCGADNSMCMNGSNAGLCRSHTCTACADTTDDANCATAYGAGNICVSGVCQMGCHDSSTCNNTVCDPTTGTCRGCQQDYECPASAPNCNVATGQCSATAVACTSGMDCTGGNGAGFCCNMKCFGGGECCVDLDCASKGGGTCVKHQCVNTTNCTMAAPPDKFYVNPSPPPGFFGVGSQQCPFKAFESANQNMPSPSPAPAPGFTICTTGTFDNMNKASWPRVIKSNVTLDGFYCDPANMTPTNFNVPSGQSGVLFNQAGPGAIYGYNIVMQSPPATKTNTGIYIANTGSTDSVLIHDVTVNSFGRGIQVTKGGNVRIIHDSHINKNGTGLTVDANSTVAVGVVAMPTSLAEFNNNDNDGIDVTHATIKLLGTNFNNMANERTVRASFNNFNGLYCQAGCNLTADHFGASGNNGVMLGIIPEGVGLSIDPQATATVKNSLFLNNNKHGIWVYGSGTIGSVNGISNLDFGDSTTAGGNVISNNGMTGFCVNPGISGTIDLVGNTFSNMASCSGSPPITATTSCAKGFDIGDDTASVTVNIGCNCANNSCP
jgi:hypothetical protein